MSLFLSPIYSLRGPCLTPSGLPEPPSQLIARKGKLHVVMKFGARGLPLPIYLIPNLLHGLVQQRAAGPHLQLPMYPPSQHHSVVLHFLRHCLTAPVQQRAAQPAARGPAARCALRRPAPARSAAAGRRPCAAARARRQTWRAQALDCSGGSDPQNVYAPPAALLTNMRAEVQTARARPKQRRALSIGQLFALRRSWYATCGPGSMQR